MSEDTRTPKFSFTVERHRDWDDVEPKPDGGWHVRLPHQCDAWDIAGADFSAASREEAIIELEEFIAEARQALAALREERELRQEW